MSHQFNDLSHERALTPDGVRIHYRAWREGTRPAVLLMHGWLGTSYTWRHVVPRLIEAGHPVIVPDMRGYGDSDKPASGYDGLSSVADVRAVLAAEKIARVHVVGWDMGALPAYLFAANHPNEVATLTYLDEPLPSVNLAQLTTFARETRGGYWHFGFNASPDLAELLIGGRERALLDYLWGLMLFDPSTITEADKQEYLRSYAGAGGVRGSVGWYRALLDTTDQIAAAVARGKLSLPVLGLGGQYGTPFTFDQLKVVAENLTGGVVPRCGHMLPEEAPAMLVEEMLAMFWKQSPSGA
jgi:pimeloyl-ACP methyl ester carboxylesterase